MDTLMLAATGIDVAAVAVLGWLAWRSGRDRDVALDVQRAALETLRADLAQLIADEEQRGRALEEALGAREQRLRALLADLGRAEPRSRADSEPRGRLASVADRLGVDPAEARLVHDLQMSFGRRTEA